MNETSEEYLCRMSAESGLSPKLSIDPRDKKCVCGRLLYPEEICDCQVERYPQETTCSNCRYFQRCKWLLNRQGTETQCDWTPSRFAAKRK